MSSVTRMIIDDPSKFSLLTADLKKKFIEGGTNTVNIAAALTRKESIKTGNNKFITRNTFTTRQIQFTPMAQGSHELSAIKSVVGVTLKAPYMARQEEGGIHRPSKGRTLAIPTDEARGGKSVHNILIKHLCFRLLKQRFEYRYFALVKKLFLRRMLFYQSHRAGVISCVNFAGG